MRPEMQRSREWMIFDGNVDRKRKRENKETKLRRRENMKLLPITITTMLSPIDLIRNTTKPNQITALLYSTVYGYRYEVSE